ncbi:MAG: B12-binding domain-containing radical SAM protein [Lachnospiraceae bacterium]|nr:B12-binding domain-containing radical SAM protein [Lachnospiraceae bacterium]
MKILLLAINSKYIHSNPAVYALKAYAMDKCGDNCVDIEIAEYTINHRVDEIVRGTYARKADVLMISTYIWNVEYVKAVINDLNKICPEVPIWLGGPEATYSADKLMAEYRCIKGIMIGEGEQVFCALSEAYKAMEDSESCTNHIVDEKPAGKEHVCDKDSFFKNIKGIIMRTADGEIVQNICPDPLDMDELPFAYENLEPFKNRIIYYESSRGCPFGCSYCLSSVEKTLRFRSLDKVFAELKHFMDNKVEQVKFVDRTFNAKHDRTMAILRFLKENDNGITNFHFEIAADLLNDEEMELMSTLRPGLIQLEIGVQSTNPKTLHAINRTANMEKLRRNVLKIYEKRNIHQHLDLIAGLPYEDIASFRLSFKDVYELKPDQLQLGFLKVLSGTQMDNESKDYGIIYSKRAPYEVLRTDWLSYEDVLCLKDIEEMVEIYYNSGQFRYSIKLLEEYFENPFDLYKALADFYNKSGLSDKAHARMDRYTILLQFYDRLLDDTHAGDSDEVKITRSHIFKQALLFDLYLRDNLKSRPIFASEIKADKELVRAFFMREEAEYRYLSRELYGEYNSKQLAKMTHIESYDYNPYTNAQEDIYILFDYKVRDALNHEARVVILKESELSDGSN